MIDDKKIADLLSKASPGPWRYEETPIWSNLKDADGDDILHYSNCDSGVYIDNEADRGLLESARSNAFAAVIGAALYDAMKSLNSADLTQDALDALRAWEALQ